MYEPGPNYRHDATDNDEERRHVYGRRRASCDKRRAFSAAHNIKHVSRVHESYRGPHYRAREGRRKASPVAQTSSRKTFSEGIRKGDDNNRQEGVEYFSSNAATDELDQPGGHRETYTREVGKTRLYNESPLLPRITKGVITPGPAAMATTKRRTLSTIKGSEKTHDLQEEEEGMADHQEGDDRRTQCTDKNRSKKYGADPSGFGISIQRRLARDYGAHPPQLLHQAVHPAVKDRHGGKRADQIYTTSATHYKKTEVKLPLFPEGAEESRQTPFGAFVSPGSCGFLRNDRLPKHNHLTNHGTPNLGNEERTRNKRVRAAQTRTTLGSTSAFYDPKDL